MSTRITDTEMTSDQTRHTAAVVPGATIEGGPTAWSVSWLPGRLLLRNQAITAMTIAEVIGAQDLTGDPLHAGHRLWVFIDGWAAELGISGPHAVAEASLSPEDHAGMARVRIDGETVTMPAAHLQFAGQAPCGLCQLRAERGVEPPPGGCSCQAAAGQLERAQDGSHR